MSKYGIPYMGSKDRICDDIIKVFPKSYNFYDLFGGGFSVTHAMILRRKNHYKNFYFNEPRPGVCKLIKDAIDGKYNYKVFKPKWVSREEFFKRKEEDFYIKICWSFGNDGNGYMFSKEIGPYKRSMHNAIVFNEFDDLARKVLGIDKFREGYSIKQKRLFLRNKIEYYRKTKIPDVLLKFLNKKQLQQLERLEQLQHIKQLEQLQQLEHIKQLERLNFSQKSYEQVNINKNSIIYCDIPYKGTAEYDKNKMFNHEKFFDWADAQKEPVFISEYNIADKRFKCVFKIKKVSLLNATDNRIFKEEKVYVNKAGFDLLMKR